MTAFLSSILAPFWPYIIAAAGAIATALGIYAKGRSDAKTKAENADLKNSNRILKDAADARDRADAAKPVAGKLPNDGWRRD